MSDDYLEEWRKVVADAHEKMSKEALERMSRGEAVDDVNTWLQDQERLLPSPPPPPGFEYLNNPVTVCPDQYLDRIAEAVYPSERHRNAVKRIRERIRYWKKKHKVCIAPHPPFPRKHVFTDNFFRWLVRTYPALKEVSWIHPHYGRVPISAYVTAGWRDAISICNGPSAPDLQDFKALYEQEKIARECLEKENTDLLRRLSDTEKKAQELETLKAKLAETRRKKSEAGRKGGRGRIARD